jgi:hypothetical protein
MCLYDYAAAVNFLDLIIFTIDLTLVYIRITCNTYPPTIRIIAFSGARLLPIITKAAIGIHA